MKRIINKVQAGVAVGCFAFVAMLFIGSAFNGEANAFFATKTGEEWLRLAACFTVVSLGFFVPSLIYDNEKMALWLRTMIHMLIGTVIYLLTAHFAGWMKVGLGATVVYISLALVAAGGFWAIVMTCFKMRARKINETIKKSQEK